MHKAIEFAKLASLAAVAAGLALAAWDASMAFAHINAPITPALWVCSGILWFCSIAWGSAAILTPFRKADAA